MTPTLKNFSVSQVELYVDCARKWYQKSILRLPDPSNEAAVRGLNIHKGVENTEARLAKGASLEEALAAHDAADAPWMSHVRALADAGLLPLPGEQHAREHRFELPTHTGIPFNGVIDLILDERSPIELTDWKSTSDVRYAKTPGELLTNLQLIVYAHYIMSIASVDVVRGRLAYVEALKKPLKTKPPRVIEVHVDLERDHVRRIWQGELPFGDQTKDLRLPRILDEMVEIGTTCTDFNDVTPTTSTCTKYGGCPFRTNCGLSPFAGISASTDHAPKKRIKIEETKTMGFLSNRTNGTNGNTRPATPAPLPQTAAAPAAAPSPAPTPTPAKTGFLAKLKGQGSQAPGGPAAQAAPQAAPAPAVVPVGVVPPDAPPRDSGVQAAPQEAPAEDAPKKRGRPKKVEAEGDGAEETVAPPKAAAKAGRRDFVIMIDCITVKGAGGVEPTHLDDFFSTIEMELNELAQAEENLPSYWLLTFGAQKAALAMKVQERIAKGLPPIMMVRSSSNAAREVLPFLLPHATQVIQSVRG